MKPSTLLSAAASVLAACTNVRPLTPTVAAPRNPPASPRRNDAATSISRDAAQKPPQGDAPHERELEPTADELDWRSGAGKSYLIPALDIVGFQLLLNAFDRADDEGTYGSDLAS